MESPNMMNLLFLGGIVVVFYFFFIRPQAKKQKEQTNFLGDLKKGDRIVTTAGIIGTITKLDETTVTMKISEKAVMDVLKSAVSKEYTDQLTA